jgi:hypothetical protein
MFKSTLVWAVAALLAVPAVPMFATTTTHHRLAAPALTHRAVAKVTSRHRLVHAKHRVIRLVHRNLSAHRLMVKHHVIRKTSAARTAVRHTALGSAPHFRVHVTKMPPTIDGIRA